MHATHKPGYSYSRQVERMLEVTRNYLGLPAGAGIAPRQPPACAPGAARPGGGKRNEEGERA